MHNWAHSYFDESLLRDEMLSHSRIVSVSAKIADKFINLIAG